MDRKRTILIISFVALIILGMGIIAFKDKIKGNNEVNINGEYKLIKVVMDGHEIDYADLNFYYTFDEENKGNIYFDDVNSKFTYEISNDNGKNILKLEQADKDTVTYAIKSDANNLIISNDNLGELHLIKAEVPQTMKK